MPLQEFAVNQAIAEVLNQMSYNWEVTAELSDELREGRGLRLDLLVSTIQRSYVAIENEFTPALTVESDAVNRVGKTLTRTGRPLAQVVALKTPSSLKNCRSTEEVKDLLPSISFEFALFQGHFDLSNEDSENEILRTPSNDRFLTGGLAILAEFLMNSSVNNRTLQDSLHELGLGVQDSIAILNKVALRTTELKSREAELFRRTFSDEDIQQGLGITSTVVINAVLFQERLSSQYPNLLSLAQLKRQNRLNQSGLIEQWEEILQIDYWPVFSVAISVLRNINDPNRVSRFIQRLFKLTQILAGLRTVKTNDLCRVIFQRFMTDRKHLASFYTRAESATLLANLAVPKLDWSDRDVYSNFKIADYACGSGTLINAAYRRLIRLHEDQNGNPRELHSVMMEENLTGADIVPSAAQVTATLLSSLFPYETYGKSKVVVPKYGLGQDGKEVSLGSLELLDDKQMLETTFPNPVAKEAVGLKGPGEFSYQLSFKQGSQDLVIMNPPHARSMFDWIEEREGTWKPYTALSNSTATQESMRVRETQLSSKIPCYNHYQSMPSMFCGLAHRMLKEGGTFAFVLPIASVQATSWSKFRKMLANDYFNVLIVSIAQKNASSCSWSADTNLAEVLVIARKKVHKTSNHGLPAGRAFVVNLYDRPINTLIAAHYSSVILDTIESNLIRAIEDEPNGGTPVKVAEQTIGEALSVPLSESPLHATGIRDSILAQWSHQLKSGLLWFPRRIRLEKPLITVRKISSFATVGFADNNIANNQSAAFDRIEATPVPAFPMIWKHDSNSQRQMKIEPDQEGRIRLNKEEHASRILDRRSHAVMAREVSYSSQSLICGYSHERVIGGRGWPNIKLETSEQEKAFVLWGNTCLGLISYWYYSSRQQVRRNIVTVSSIRDIPWLDPTSLTKNQLLKTSQLFDEYESETFLPAGQANKDPIRMQLDKQFLVGVLAFPTDVYKAVEILRDKWCSEPAVMSN
ncbi:MAG: hypothetical protein OXC80_07580 [Gammaproteobacteria bacterium]|nr:hypothetical protein [Gammaproteobacteria bacterium]